MYSEMHSCIFHINLIIILFTYFLTPLQCVFQAPPADGSSVSVDVSPESQRLQLLSPFDRWNPKNILDMTVLIKVLDTEKKALRDRLQGKYAIDNREYGTDYGKHAIDNREYGTDYGKHAIDNREYRTDYGKHAINNREYRTLWETCNR